MNAVLYAEQQIQHACTSVHAISVSKSTAALVPSDTVVLMVSSSSTACRFASLLWSFLLRLFLRMCLTFLAFCAADDLLGGQGRPAASLSDGPLGTFCYNVQPRTLYARTRRMHRATSPSLNWVELETRILSTTLRAELAIHTLTIHLSITSQNSQYTHHATSTCPVSQQSRVRTPQEQLSTCS